MRASSEALVNALDLDEASVTCVNGVPVAANISDNSSLSSSSSILVPSSILVLSSSSILVPSSLLPLSLPHPISSPGVVVVVVIRSISSTWARLRWRSGERTSARWEATYSRSAVSCAAAAPATPPTFALFRTTRRSRISVHPAYPRENSA